MGTTQISRSALVAVAAVVALLFGAAFWWSTRPKGNAEAYSASTARLEQSDALKRAVEAEEWRQKNPEAARALRQAHSDKEYQPESGEN
ncbi:MAG: hypothetical protein K0Q72_1974 [Armatimonadetes bacterium]|jgi:Flp pilus assembly protein TadB|nr:hypothetical protein [Armatimonadota bacterium]